MYRCGSGFLLSLAIIFILAFTGCLGNSTANPGNGGVTSVTLSPVSSVSMDVGTTQVFTATGKNAQGGAVLGADIRFVVGVPQGASNAPTISVASNGNTCAGTWDASFSICNPGTIGPSTVTAVINGVSSEPTTVYVHQHVDSIQIQQAESQPPTYPCFSQGQTWKFKGLAYSNNVDITNSVGPLTWSFSNNGVVTTTAVIPPDQPNVLNQVQTTAKSPGITQLFASVSSTTSSPYPFTTCPVQYIRLQAAGQGQVGNSVTINNGNSISITATVVDVLGFTLNAPPLTWSSTSPEVAAFSSTTNSTGTNNATARNNLGGYYRFRFLQSSKLQYRNSPGTSDLCQRWTSAKRNERIWHDLDRRDYDANHQASHLQRSGQRLQAARMHPAAPVQCSRLRPELPPSVPS